MGQSSYRVKRPGGDEFGNRIIEILENGQKIRRPVAVKGGAPHLFDMESPVPAGLVKHGQKVAVLFPATGAKEWLTLKEVQAAAERLRRELRIRPCSHSQTLSRITGAEVYLKFENHSHPIAG